MARKNPALKIELLSSRLFIIILPETGLSWSLNDKISKMGWEYFRHGVICDMLMFKGILEEKEYWIMGWKETLRFYIHHFYKYTLTSWFRLFKWHSPFHYQKNQCSEIVQCYLQRNQNNANKHRSGSLFSNLNKFKTFIWYFTHRMSNRRNHPGTLSANT